MDAFTRLVQAVTPELSTTINALVIGLVAWLIVRNIRDFDRRITELIYQVRSGHEAQDKKIDVVDEYGRGTALEMVAARVELRALDHRMGVVEGRTLALEHMQRRRGDRRDPDFTKRPRR